MVSYTWLPKPKETVVEAGGNPDVHIVLSERGERPMEPSSSLLPQVSLKLGRRLCPNLFERDAAFVR